MRPRTVTSILLFGSIVLSLFVVATASGANANPRILPVNAKPYGHTYGEWSAEWWQYVFSIPEATNPLLDTTGANCAVGQSGPVFFLVGLFSLSSTATADRDCTVPSGRALFFPVLNSECDNVGIDPPLTVDVLRQACASNMDAATNMSATLDGTAIAGLESTSSPYRVQSPVFSYTLPEENIYEFFGMSVPAGPVSPVVGDGYYLMLAPLSRGAHTLRFHGAAGTFTLDVTYHLTVGS